MQFKFKIWDKIKEAWPLYKENFWSFMLFILVMIGMQFLLQREDSGWLLKVLVYILNILFSFILIRSILTLLDKKTFKPFTKESIPSYKQFWDFIKTNFLTSLIVFTGFILLIIPGIYISGRLLFASYISVEKSQGARKNIRESWDMTKGYGWKLIWKSFLIGLYAIIGIIALFVGILVTYPIAMILTVMLYREFLKAKSMESMSGKNETIVVPEIVEAPVPASTQTEEIKEVAPIISEKEDVKSPEVNN